jgi:hypothetical protein
VKKPIILTEEPEVVPITSDPTQIEVTLHLEITDPDLFLNVFGNVDVIDAIYEIFNPETSGISVLLAYEESEEEGDV